MKKRYVALLRAITNVSMKPFREKMEDLGFTDVASYGISGNLLFNAKRSKIVTLERLISEQFGTRDGIDKLTISKDHQTGSIQLEHTVPHPPKASKRKSFLQLDFESTRPVI